ncbi:MAG: peptidylprolyl isomerase [Rickettsiales bacterium]|nr:peptidylprolyl isomerase [Rickettsiales bacterium]
MFKKILFSIFILLFSLNSYAVDFQVNEDNQISSEEKALEPKNTLYIELKNGIVIAELFPNIAPLHAQRIRTLTQSGFYDNVKFHRVIDGFMVQTGDPTGTGRGGSKLGRLYAEFNNEHHTRGTLSMARSSDPNSANSQFFIVTGEFFPELDGQYTVFGRVVEGIEYVDKIKSGDSSKNGMVDNPDLMMKVITGDMLNNKSLTTVKEEIKLVNEMQAQKLKEDPTYQKKSVLGILLETKDIDINQDNKDDKVLSPEKIDDNSIKDTDNIPQPTVNDKKLISNPISK